MKNPKLTTPPKESPMSNNPPSRNTANNDDTVNDDNTVNSESVDNESVENTSNKDFSDKENSTGIEHLIDNDDTEEEDYSNDVVLDAQDDRGLIEQEDDILNWEVVGLYKDNGKMYPARYLKRNPPVLTLKNDSGMEANFVLTKNLSYQLRYAVDSVYKGYFNIESAGIDDDKTESRIKKWLPLVIIGVAVAVTYIMSVAL